jgi:hypothetical protein
MTAEPNRASDRRTGWRRSPPLVLHHMLELYSEIVEENSRRNSRHPGILVYLLSNGNRINGCLSADKFVGHDLEQLLMGNCSCKWFENHPLLFVEASMGITLCSKFCRKRLPA